MEWQAPGPKSRAFMLCWDLVLALMGPIGSGKTTTALLKVAYFAALLQKPGPDGVRRWRVASIRDTYRQVWRATIPSWLSWFPKTAGEFTGSDGGPTSHKLTLKHPADGGLIEIEINFLAIGDNQIEDVLRGYELSAIHLGEGDLLHPNVLIFCRGRVGRYPRRMDGGCAWPGVVVEYNAPDIDNYLYHLFEEDMPEEHRLFRLPSGLSPQAENVQNLPDGYYQRQIAGQPDWYVRRMIRNEYGYSRDGQPVFAAEFNDALHVAAEPFEPVPGIPIEFSCDAGGTPAGLFRQKMPNGQRRYFDELVVAENAGFCGPRTFGRYVRERLGRYPGIECIGGRADPSAWFGADQKAGELNWILTVSDEAKIRLRPASTNKLLPRLEAIRVPLTQLIDGEPAILISPRCRVLRKALNSGYRYKKKRLVGEERYETEPDKNEYSHVVDGMQYMELDDSFDAMNGRERQRKSERHRPGAAILVADEDEVAFYGRGGDAEL